MKANELTVHQLQGWCYKEGISIQLFPDGTIYGSQVEETPVQTPLEALAAMVSADTEIMLEWPDISMAALEAGAAALEAEHLGDPVKETGIYAPPPSSARWLLEQAAEHMRARASTYDKPAGERSMSATVAAVNAITGLKMTESEGWLFMAVLKMVRDRSRVDPHRDSCEDLVAYSALYGEARLAESASKPAANDNEARAQAHG